MNVRTSKIGQLASKIAEIMTRQIVIYSGRVNHCYQLARDRNVSEGEKNAAKSAVFERWFPKGALESKNEYSYEEIREKFRWATFNEADEILASTVLKIKEITFSVPREDSIYDANGFLIAGRLIVKIEVEDGFPINPFLQKHGKIGKGTGIHTNITENVTENWEKNSVALTIPIAIEGDGKNFWID
jgi:hypothetical protein